MGTSNKGEKVNGLLTKLNDIAVKAIKKKNMKKLWQLYRPVLKFNICIIKDIPIVSLKEI